MNRIFSKIIIGILILSPISITGSGRVALSQERIQSKEQTSFKTRRHEFQIDLKQGKATIKPVDDFAVKQRTRVFRASPTTAQSDVTNQIKVQASNFQFDFQNNIFSFDVTLTNISQSTVLTPVKAIVENLRPGPPEVTVVNADGGGTGNGTFWDFSAMVGGDNALSPSETSGKRNWQFSTPGLKLFSFTVKVEGGPPPPTPPAAPIVNQPTSPTNQTNIQVTGTTDPNLQVDIAGGVQPVTTTANGVGAFNATVQLDSNRVNFLFVTATNTAGPSPATPVTVTHDVVPPDVFIDVPQDSAQLTNALVTVAGRVGDLLSGSLGTNMTVNGLTANVNVGLGTNGTYERMNVPLALGPNTITVVATDAAGNSATEQVTVTRIDVTGQPQMVILSGNNQRTQVLTELAQPIIVKVTQANGQPFVNKVVTLDVTRSNGRLSGMTPVTGDTMMLQVRTDVNGEARAFWKLGSDAGCANNRVDVTSMSIAGTILFCASADPAPAAQINIGMGNNQRAEVGGPAMEPLEAWVNDTFNGIPNVSVTFTVAQGGGLVNGSNQVVVNTSLTGHAEVDFTLGPNSGNHIVEATFLGNPGRKAMFTVFAVERDTSVVTSFTGLVLNSADQPIENVTCTLDIPGQINLQATTDSTGFYSFANIPSGLAHVVIGGSTATAINGNPIPAGSFPELSYDPVIVPNVENKLQFPVHLPFLNPNNFVLYDGTQDVELTVEGIEGFKMIVKQGSMTNADGSVPSIASPAMLSLNQVHFDKVPMALPNGIAPPYAGTLHPIGATFNPPVEIHIPNFDGLPAGAVNTFLNFNHDTNQFEPIATGHVTGDGSMFVSDTGSGIPIAGWHSPAPPPPPGGESCNGQCETPEDAPAGDDDECPNNSDPVYLFSGEFYISFVDLQIKGRGLDFVWERKYRSRIGPDTGQGNGWDFSYNIFIEPEGDGFRLCNGETRSDLYLSPNDSTFTRGEFFRELGMNPDSTFTMQHADQLEWNFHRCDTNSTSGMIESIMDRNGNQLTFHYDSTGRLERINDTLNRDILIGYDANGFISTVTDFAGRVVSYQYYDGIEPGGGFGDLKSVTTPTVTGTPNGNDFPNGKTTTYTYSTGFGDQRLNHNLLTITDGRRNDPGDPTFGSGPYLINIYDNTLDPADLNFDRLTRQIWGADTVDVVYVQQTPTPNDRSVLKTILNDRNGNVTEYFYDARNREIKHRRFAGRADPTQPTTETTNRPTGKFRVSDPDFFETIHEHNFDALPTRTIHPNGNITEYIYEFDLDPNAPARFRGNLRTLRRLPGSHTPAGDQTVIEELFEYDTGFGGCCGFNFVNKHIDGRGNETLHTYDNNGNRIFTQHRISTIIEDFEYNQFGQMTAHVWPDNGSTSRRRDEFTYYAAGPQRGYLEDEIIDALNFALTTTYQYDLVGNVINVTDPRGHDTQYLVNELDQVVREISREVTNGAGVRYERDTFYDANDNLMQLDVQNIDDQGVLQANTHFTTTYDYEILNYRIRMTEEVDAGSNIVTEYDYDNNRNLTQSRFGEATNGNQPTNTINRIYDERDLLFQEIRAQGDPDQSTTQFDYDSNQNLVTKSVGLEETPHVWNTIYDSYDREVTMTDPMGNVMTYNYDANHNRLMAKYQGERVDIPGSAGNERLSQVASAYDDMDRLIQQDEQFFDTDTQTPIADGQATIFTFYSDNSQVVRVVDDNNRETLTAYDTANRVGTVTDDKDNTITYAYDANSNVISSTEVEKSDLGNPDETFVTLFDYDNLDRLIQTTDNVANINEYGYDSRNNRTLHSDALRTAPANPGNITRFDYDGINRLTNTTRFLTDDGTGSGIPAGQIVTLQGWDDSHRLITQTDDNGNATTYTYDALNRKTATTYADSTIHSDTYDVHDNALTMLDANGSVATCTYDQLDRLVGKSIAQGPGIGGTTFEIFQYDGLSRIVLAQDDDSQVTRSYNSLSNVTRETLNGQTITSVFDGVGNKTMCTYPGGRVITTTYDQLDRKQVISDGVGPIATYDYIGPRRVERRDYGNNTRMSFAYDGVKRITGTTHTIDPGGTPQVFDDRSYTWDKMYNKTSRNDLLPNGRTHTYTYDSIYRLIQSVKTEPAQPDTTIDYSFDGVGNRTQVTGGRNPGTYTVDPTLPEPADFQMNQYTSTSFDDRLYDPNGNLNRINDTLPNQRDFTYDYRNLMIKHVDLATGDTARYSYDALGRRIEKVLDDGATIKTTRYFYCNWRVYEEQDENSVTLATYVYGLYIDEVLNMQRNSLDYFYHADELYNVMSCTDAAGSIAESYKYDDFGQSLLFSAGGSPIAQSVIGNPYEFTGRRLDFETNYYYYRTRYLDSETGRFTSRDVIDVWGDSGNLGNGRAFLANNPFTNVDPYGLKSEAECYADLEACLRRAEDVYEWLIEEAGRAYNEMSDIIDYARDFYVGQCDRLGGPNDPAVITCNRYAPSLLSVAFTPADAAAFIGWGDVLGGALAVRETMVAACFVAYNRCSTNACPTK